MHFRRLASTLLLAAATTAGLAVGTGTASAADEYCPILQSGERYTSISCTTTYYHYADGDVMGYTVKYWYQGLRVADFRGWDCTTYSQGGQVQGSSCVRWYQVPRT